MTTYDYQAIENLLFRSLCLLIEVFNDSEKKEVQDFIDAGEYGLALETLVDVVVEEKKEIPSEFLNLVNELAKAMEFDNKVFEEKLRSLVNNT